MTLQRIRNGLPLLCAAALSGQSISFDLTTVPVSGSPQSLVMGDFNKDGKPDLAVTTNDPSGAGAVEILLGNGDATFRPTGTPIAVGTHATRIVVADFNKDGKLDLAVSVGHSGHVVILLGNGDGTFYSPFDVGTESPAGQDPTALAPGLAVGDVNGDGKPDLVLGPYTLASSSPVAVLLGNGDGTFQNPVITALDPIQMPRAVVSDFNGDGKADVFLTGLAGELEASGLLDGQANGSLKTAWWNVTVGTADPNGYPIVVTDVNGNGKPDVIVALFGGFQTWTYLDGGTNPVVSGVNLFAMEGAIPGRFPTTFVDNVTESLAAADVNGDGKPDLVLTDNAGNLFVLLGDGDGMFSAPPAFPPPVIYTGASTTPKQTFVDVYGSITTADLRGVGKPDVIMAVTGKSVVVLKNGAAIPPIVNSVVSAAALTPGPAVPGSLMTIFGSGLAYDSGTSQFSPFPANQVQPALDLPVTLFGLTVNVNGQSAPLLWASPDAANTQIPWELAGQTEATLVVSRNGATRTISVPVSAYAPAFFAMNAQGTGQAVAIINGAADAVAAREGEFPRSRPVHRGEYISLFGTGLGPVTYQPWTGNAFYPGPYPTIAPPFSFTTSAPTVTIGGVPAQVQFSGLAPFLLGVYQINVLIPAAAPAGDTVSIGFSIGGVASSNTLTIAIN